MDMLAIILINSIFVLFPLLCYIIYNICMENSSQQKKEFFLDFALISSCYLIMRYGLVSSSLVPNLMFHIPLILAYLLNRKVSIVILSIIGLVYYSSYDFGIFVVSAEYILYFILYILKQKYKKLDYLYVRLFVFLNTLITFIWLITDESILDLSWNLKIESLENF